MEDIKTRERNAQSKVIKKSFFITLIMLGIIGIISLFTFFSGEPTNKNYTSNPYSFSGEILNFIDVYPEISLYIEKNEEGVFGVTLKNGELVSKVLFCNIDTSEINDFTICMDDYNNDKNKDFIYLNSKEAKGYSYKFYSVDKTGNITEMGLENINLDIKKASAFLIKNGEKFEYKSKKFYYDGYEVNADIGTYELKNKKENTIKTISKDSKIAIEGRYNAFPRKISKLRKVPEIIENLNSYLEGAEEKQCIKVDLDGDKFEEHIVYWVKDNMTRITMFDDSGNDLVVLANISGNKKMKDIFEIADIDDDDIMELILIKDNIIEVHEYNRGFYY